VRGSRIMMVHCCAYLGTPLSGIVSEDPNRVRESHKPVARYLISFLAQMLQRKLRQSHNTFKRSRKQVL